MKLNDFGLVLENYSLENYNTYGLKTKTKYLIKVKDEKSLIDLMSYLKENNLKYYLLGKGSNVILPDEDFDGVIISLECLDKIEFEDNILKVECGAILSKVVMSTIAKSLGGLESLATIPGTVGGALVGNAGFFKDKTIYDNLVSVFVLIDGVIKEVKKDEIIVKHRYSSFKESKAILVRAIFKLYQEDQDKMLELVKEMREKRAKTQPLTYKNAGSVFRNPEGYSAGKLIDDANLKGYHINDAYISLIHANFIINKGNATSKDIKELIKYIQKKIKEINNIDLELEQVIVDWKENGRGKR